MLSSLIKDFYPSTDNEYVFQSLHLFDTIFNVDPVLYKLIIKALKLVQENSFFACNKKIYRQTSGQSIGGDSAGDVCDFALAIRELLNYEDHADLRNTFVSYNRYRDDIWAFLHKWDATRNNLSEIIELIYGDQFEFEVTITSDPHSFLDYWIWFDVRNNCIRTKPFFKPGQIVNYTRPNSNVPHSVLKSILGLQKRFIVISDTYEAFQERKQKLIQDLLSIGWSAAEIRKIPDKYWPSYKNRQLFIDQQWDKFTSKLHNSTAVEIESPVSLFTTFSPDENEIVFNAGEYNCQVDNLSFIKQALDHAAQELPSVLSDLKFIVCHRASPNLEGFFRRTL